MQDAFSTRFYSADWFPKETTYTLIGGAGGIGSWLTLLLTRAGFTPLVYDFDNIEAHNLGGQLYGFKDIGKSKVDALHDLVYSLTGMQPLVYNSMYGRLEKKDKFTFSAFDNMEARSIMYHSWNKYVSERPSIQHEAIFIDGRLLAEQLQIFAIPWVAEDRRNKYEKEHLFSDEEAHEGVCSFKQTSHVAAMIASLMVSTFTNHLVNIKTGTISRIVPFYYEYFTPLHLQELQL